MHLDLSKWKCDINNYVMEGVWKADNVEISSPNCPRCGSSNTKFCYYNNYSLTQPRYFCKGCRRYWTKGGSLRNIPIGGGCRKNRRAKSFRILTTDRDGLASNGGMAYGDPTPHDPSGSALAKPTTSSSGQHDASNSNIDLALVYANFLNQKPEPKSTGFEILPELPCEFHPSFHLSTLSTNTNTNTNTNLDSSDIQLPPETSHLSEDNQIYLSGFHPIHTSNIYGLPPLPGQEVASQEMLWPNSQLMLHNQTLQQTQLMPALQPEAAQHPNVPLTAGNWSPFDLSCYETFSPP